MQSVLCPVLIDRDDALATVHESLAGARGAGGRVVFVLGEAGTGKSRLAGEAKAMAVREGLVVLSGRAVCRSAPAPYRPLAEALQSLRSDPRQEVGEASELAVAETVVRALAAAGRHGGCLLVLEDLHWADPETLAVVEYLADHLAGERVLVLGTVRTGESSTAERMVHLLRERRVTEVVNVRRLGPEATDRMLAACLGTGPVPPEIRRFIEDHAEGVPLFIEELLAGVVDSGALVQTPEGWRVTGPLTPVTPLTYVELIRRRLQGLDPLDQDVVLAAAVLGRRFIWSLLPAMTRRDERSVLESLRRATAAFLLEPEDDPVAFRFRHALARDAVIGELLPPEAASMAARALDALEAAPTRTGDDADLAAELAERAGDRPRAVAALLEVSRRALRRGAVASARGALERAARLARPRADLSVLVEEAQAHAAALAGHVDEAIQRAAVVLAAVPPGETSADRRARLHLTLARASLTAGRRPDAARHVTDALSLTAAEAANPALRASAEALAAHVAMAEGREADAASLARSVLGRTRIADAPAAACEALEVLGRIARRDDLAAAKARFLEALAVATQHDLAMWRARALHELGTIDLYAGTRSDRFEAAREAAVEAGAVAMIALCDLHLAVYGSAHWDVERGIAAGRRCVDLSRRLGLDTLGMGLVHLATCLALAGEAEEMEPVLAEASTYAAHEPDVAAGIPGRARMALAVRRADLRGVCAALDDAMAVVSLHPGLPFPLQGMWALLRTVEDPTGDGGASARAQVAATPAGVGAVMNRVCLDLAEAIADARRGQGDEAADVVDATLVAGPMPGAGEGWAALVLAIVASSALRDRWGHGERWARHALARFEALDMNELASWCRAMLRDAGLPVPRRGRGASAPSADLRALGVTSRESDVLQVLVTGASNNEIAARLHLSPRTVERHVSNLLTKTGSGDRRDLARLAASTGHAARP